MEGDRKYVGVPYTILWVFTMFHDKNIFNCAILSSFVLFQVSCNKKLSFPTAWMELESMMLSEISQVAEDKYHVISPVRGT